MISYEDLCAALDKVTALRRNEAELSSALDKGNERPGAEASPSAAAAARKKAITEALPQNWGSDIDPEEDIKAVSASEIELDEVLEE